MFFITALVSAVTITVSATAAEITAVGVATATIITAIAKIKENSKK